MRCASPMNRMHMTPSISRQMVSTMPPAPVPTCAFRSTPVTSSPFRTVTGGSSHASDDAESKSVSMASFSTYSVDGMMSEKFAALSIARRFPFSS